MRRRVAALAYELGPRRAATPAPPSLPSPGGAFALGVIIPGGGQYYTHRPVFGLLVTAATAGALFYGLQQKTVIDSLTGTDPFGKTYRYAVTTTKRSNLGAGVGAAAAVSLLAAIEASAHARAAHHAAAVASAVTVEPTSRGGVLLGLRLALLP